MERCYTREKRYQFDTCDIYFTLKRNLQIHERSHTGERSYQCKTCEK